METTWTGTGWLDYYQGFPNFYDKEMIQVDFGGKMVEGMAYDMSKERPLGVPDAS